MSISADDGARPRPTLTPEEMAERNQIMADAYRQLEYPIHDIRMASLVLESIFARSYCGHDQGEGSIVAGIKERCSYLANETIWIMADDEIDILDYAIGHVMNCARELLAKWDAGLRKPEAHKKAA